MPDFLVLTAGDWLRGEYVASLIGSLADASEAGLTYDYGNGQSALVARARQSVYEATRKKEFERLIWIDGDISWRSNDFMALLQSEYDVLSGVYLDDNQKVVALNLNGDRVSREQLEGQEPFEVAWCGFGFVSLSKDVVAALPEPFIKNGEYGEDVSFCMNARNMGFKVFLDPTIKVTHHKTIAITP